MASPNEQLKQIYQELTELFEKNEHIKIIPFDDEPPEKYEIKYFLSGVIQHTDGKIAESREHSVFINIPFGFPHFPPSCTPQSSTFHPDFDQAAICIGEFWNKDRSLPELIVYIGKMITGEIYSTENAFNETAVSWYQKNASRLPFQQIDFSLPIKTSSADDIFDIPEDELLLHGIDTLQDEDIAGQDDFFGTSHSSTSSKDAVTSEADQLSDRSTVNRVHTLIRQRRYYELSKAFNHIPADYQFEDREEIEGNVKELMQKAVAIQKEADEAEHQGDPKTALGLFKQIFELVPDFPDIEENISRAQKSVELASEWAQQADAPDTEEPADANGSKAKKRVAFFEETTKATIKFLPVLGVVIVLLLAVSFTIPFFGAKSNLGEAEKLYSQCEQLLKNNNFSQAKRVCEEAQETLQQISFFKKKESKALQRDIQQTLTSQKLVQGLSGRVFFQGKYVQKLHMNRVIEFTEHKKEADQLFEQESWTEAAAKYATTLEGAKPILDSLEPIVIREIQNKKEICDINISLERGDSLLGRGELEKSQDQLTEALKKAEKLPEELGGNLIQQIRPKLQNIKYLQHLDLGKKYFYSNNWESAIQQYEEALQLQDQSLVPLSGDEKDSLYANMAEAELYALINSAKDAFSQSQLAVAIDRYNSAISLLNSKNDLLKRINPQEIEQQLKRIILRTKIVRFKQIADEKLEKTEYRQAIAAFGEVIGAITSSGYQDDQEFRSIITGTQKSIAQAQQKAAIADRVAYLVGNYKKIFETNYSAAVPEYLSDPKAVFLKFEGNKELYEIQCIETQRGRKLRLVMLYSYDPARKRWDFYSEPTQ